MNLNQIVKAQNVVDLLDDDKRNEIATQIVERYNYDYQSRSSKLENLVQIMKLALAVADEKSFPWPNASNTIYPLIATASIEFAAKCSPEILRDDFIVKPKVIGKDEGTLSYNVDGSLRINEETGQAQLKDVKAKEERGQRVSTYMNYQLNEEIKDWVPNTDKLLVSLATVGMMFRKTYRDKNNNIISEIVYPDKLICHDKTTNFDKAPKTHIIELYENEIQERIRKDIFIKFDYDENSSDITSAIQSNDLSNSQDDGRTEDVNSGLHVFLEQCCWLDLDDDDFVEPYVGTVHYKSNKLVKLLPLFKEEDIIKENKKIVEIKAHNPYTPYPFIPAADGSFYSIGLGHLLFNLNKSVNSSINQLTDAATLQTTGGGFIAKNLKIRGGAFKLRPNEYKMVDDFGGSIKDSIVPLPTPEPSQTLFALLGFLVQSGKELGSLRDMVNGENAANIQATTMMALVEQGITQFRSIYKRVFRSLKDEFRIIYNINSKYLTNDKYAEVLDEPVLEVDAKGDFSKKGFDIVPVADVASITNTQRMAKASFLMQFLNDPYVDQIQLRERIFSSFNIDNFEDLIITPADPGPDVATVLAQAELVKAENKLKEIQIQAIETSSSIEKTKYDNEKIVAEIEKLKSDTLKNISDAFATEREAILRTAETIRQDIESRVINQNEERKNEMVQEEEKQESI